MIVKGWRRMLRAHTSRREAGALVSGEADIKVSGIAKDELLTVVTGEFPRKIVYCEGRVYSHKKVCLKLPLHVS